MTYADIFLHLDTTEGADARNEYALALAETQGAHITAYAISATPATTAYGLAPIPLEMVELQHEMAEEGAKLAIENFGEKSSISNVACETLTATGVVGAAIREIAVDARHADLMITGQPHPESGIYYYTTQLIEDILYSAGRPVLVIPYIGAKATPPANILVAWDGGLEATRSIHDAMPLLKAAQKVTVMVIDSDKRPERHGEEPGADMARHLARHGVETAVAQEVSAGLNIGDFLLSRVADGDHDLLVMGGYSHSRLREMVIGGVTRTIIESMTVPVFLSH